MKKILWIEDEENSLEQYIAPILSLEIKIDFTNNAEEAINYLRLNKYDLVIFDLIINAGDYETEEEYVGFGLIKDLFDNKIQGVKFDKSTKTMVFTVIEKPEIISKLYKIGINKILIKRRLELNHIKKTIDNLSENAVKKK